jgi:hypothetical protein
MCETRVKAPGKGPGRPQLALTQVSKKALPVTRQVLENQEQEAWVPYRDEGEIASTEQEVERHIAECLEVLGESHGIRNREGGVDEPTEEAAQIGGVVLESQGDTPLREGGRASYRRDRPIAAAGAQ